MLLRSRCALISAMVVSASISLTAVDCSGQVRGGERRGETVPRGASQGRDASGTLNELPEKVDWMRGGWIQQVLKLEDLQGELEILDYQLEDLRTGAESILDEFNEARTRILRDAGDENTSELRARLYYGANDKLDVLIRENLLPHQVDRLNQVVNWTVVNSNGGLCQFLLDGGGELEPDQIEKLSELNDQYLTELNELKQRYREELLSSYSEADRERLRQMLGEPSMFNLLRFGF